MDCRKVVFWLQSFFNTYTNDQPIIPDASHYVYTDNTTIAIPNNNFEVESKLEFSLKIIIYYKRMKLKPNPIKIQIDALYLKNKQTDKKLNITRKDVKIEHTLYPEYLDVTVDRSLTIKEHCVALKRKI